jgi:hypothetical protein
MLLREKALSSQMQNSQTWTYKTATRILSILLAVFLCFGIAFVAKVVAFPYSGIELRPVALVVYWVTLLFWSALTAYFLVFEIVPAAGVQLQRFRTRGKHAPAHTGGKKALAHSAHAALPAVPEEEHLPIYPYSAYDGFKSYATNGALSIEDIVKGLSRSHAEEYQKNHEEGIRPDENVEPVYDLVEPIGKTRTEMLAPIVRTFVSALLEGDRNAVFAALREYTQKTGAPHKLVEKAVYALDDAYRGRVDGSPCDEHIARQVARFDTKTLERIVSSLTTAVDTSYTDSVTAAKLAVTRALSTLGA